MGVIAVGIVQHRARRRINVINKPLWGGERPRSVVPDDLAVVVDPLCYRRAATAYGNGHEAPITIEEALVVGAVPVVPNDLSVAIDGTGLL